MVEKFGKFKLSEREKQEVVLSSSDIKHSREICEQSLVEKVYGENGVNFTGLRQLLQSCSVQMVL